MGVQEIFQVGVWGELDPEGVEATWKAPLSWCPTSRLTYPKHAWSKTVEELPRNRPSVTATQQQTAVDTWSSVRSAQHL
jgi:hypothetical protein